MAAYRRLILERPFPNSFPRKHSNRRARTLYFDCAKYAEQMRAVGLSCFTMKTTSVQRSMFEPTDDEIRDYAHHLYEQSGCIPGRDLENWLEARDCLMAQAKFPKTETHLQKRHSELVGQH